jgi:hypothetical protein
VAAGAVVGGAVDGGGVVGGAVDAGATVAVVAVMGGRVPMTVLRTPVDGVTFVTSDGIGASSFLV